MRDTEDRHRCPEDDGGIREEERLMLLIDYMQDASLKIQELTESLQKLDVQYRRSYDRDTRREMSVIKTEIKKTKNDARNELLFRLEEFRYLDKYFPELLKTFMEDNHIGPVMKKKAWLLDFKPVPAKQAAMKLDQLKVSRMQLMDAKKTLVGWVGDVSKKAFVATYPILEGHMKGDMDKDEALEMVEKVSKLLLREGWLLLISDSLIKIPIAKFMNRIQKLRTMEMQAEMLFAKARGKGTVAETAALRELEKIRTKKDHYERILRQVLLSNPKYLRSMKRKKDWLSREGQSGFEKFIQGVTPHKVKERAWLNEMKKKIDIEEK
jgi:hypothetical protein